MLRITAGLFKGKHLEIPPESITRPSSDRLRQAVFNILLNHLDFNGIKVLDAFAGSGALGLESLSRGASHTTFCENNLLVQKILKKNILETVKEKSILASVHSDLFQFTECKKFDLVFLDPPYGKHLEIKAIEHIVAYKLLNKNAIIIVEQCKNANPISINQLSNIDIRTYGKCQVQFLVYDSSTK